LKQYNLIAMAQRVVALDAEGGTVNDALIAGEDLDPHKPSIIMTHFGAVNRETEDKESKQRPHYQRRSKADVEGPLEDRRYAGPAMPKRVANASDLDDFDTFLQELGV
ncbi:MAG: hypothetical protein ACLFR0_09560, partial [Alphaproteobacteria bacterium]